MNELGIVQLATSGSGVGVWALVGIAVITLIKGWPALRKLSIESDGSFRRDLMERIKVLEDELRAERLECVKQLEALRGEIAGLQRQMLTMQMVSGQPIPLDKMPPETAKAVTRLADMIRRGECGDDQ